MAHRKSQSPKYALEISFRLRIKIRSQVGTVLKGAVAVLTVILARLAKHFFLSG